MFSLRPWARQLAVAYGILTIVLTIVVTILNGVFVVMPMFDQPVPDDNPALMGARIGAIIGLFASGLGLIYPALLWYFMSRPHVVAAFHGAAQPQPVDLGNVPTGPLMPPRDPTNPYSAPQAELVAPMAATASPSIVETFIPDKNQPALLSYYLGLFSLFPCLGFFLGVVAVYFGIKGLRLVRQHPEVRGGAHAWVGLICGGLFGMFNFALLAASAIGVVAVMMEQR
jgi:hypothetical protein